MGSREAQGREDRQGQPAVESRLSVVDCRCHSLDQRVEPPAAWLTSFKEVEHLSDEIFARWARGKHKAVKVDKASPL